MKSLGLDLSLVETGWCVSTEYGCGAKGVISTAKDEFRGSGELTRRIHTIVQRANDIIAKEMPDVIVIEGFAMRAQGRVFDLAELGGAMKQSLYYGALPNGDKPAILICPPKSLKTFAGHGNADKPMMRQFAEQYGQVITNNNICDAFFLTLVGLCYFKIAFPICTWTPKQNESVKKIELLREAIKSRRRIH
jgi:Holliday junction resolvasome RuvABC endonuclease subunit